MGVYVQGGQVAQSSHNLCTVRCVVAAWHLPIIRKYRFSISSTAYSVKPVNHALSFVDTETRGQCKIGNPGMIPKSAEN
jgi:hypothetical protein